MALIDIPGEDSWMKEYNYVERLIGDILETTVKRRQLQLGDLQHSIYSSKLRREIPQAELQLAVLLDPLEKPQSKHLKISTAEWNKRLKLCKELQSILNNASSEFYKGLSSRLDGQFNRVADLGTVSWEAHETDSTRNVSNQELYQQRGQMMEAQDAVLGNLSEVVQSQKRIATTIGQEVDDQDDLLIDIKERTSSTQTGLHQQTATIAGVTRRSSQTWGYWLVIVVLLVAIIIVAVW